MHQMQMVMWAEDSSVDNMIYNAFATDIDDDVLTYLVSGTDASYFTIDTDNGEIRLLEPANYETKDIYTFDVTASDGVLSDTKTVTVNVTDVNEVPFLTTHNTSTVEENAYIDTVIYDAEATDPDGDDLTYSISGTSASYVEIDEDNGEVRLLNPADYETKDSYTFDVTVSDGELYDTKTITVNVTDVEEAPNEAPTLTGGSGFILEYENISSDKILSTYTAEDPNGDTLTYSLSGSDAALFDITDNGELSFIDPPDYESMIAAGKMSYSLTVNVSDDEFTATYECLGLLSSMCSRQQPYMLKTTLYL